MRFNTIANISQTITQITFPLFIFLLPLFFLPFTPNIFETNKLLALIIATSIISLSCLISAVIKNNLKLKITPFIKPLLVLATIFVLSSILNQPNPTQAFMGKGLIIPLLTILFIAITSFGESSKQKVKHQFTISAIFALLASAATISLLTIFQYFSSQSLSSSINQLFSTNLPTNRSFHPTGSPLSTLTFLLPSLVLAAILVTRKSYLKKTWRRLRIVFYSALITLITLGLFATSSQVISELTDQQTNRLFPTFRQSYSIMLETFKRPAKTALLGFGPEAYINAYTLVRPAQSNLQENWNQRFFSARNELFTVSTTTGILGTVAFLYLLYTIAKQSNISLKGSKNHLLTVIAPTTIVLFLLQLLLPANFLLLTFSFIFLTLWSLQTATSHQPLLSGLRERASSSLRPISTSQLLLGLVSLVAISYFLYLTSKAYSAEMAFKQSLDAALQNQGLATYQLQQKAIRTNPRIANYHRAFAITNLALANSISQNQELTQEQKSSIPNLIRDSINSAKNAVALDSQNTQNWETLAGIYRQLINVANNADQWTVASYTQAIRTDPLNPRLRLDLGSIYYNLQQYNQAIRLFQQATELKPDWPNAYFNLSLAYQEKEEFVNALQALQIASRFVKPDSADFTTVQDKVNEIRQALNLETQEPVTQPSELSPPQPLPSPILEQPLDLPEESGPQTLEQEEEVTEEITNEEQLQTTPTPTLTP